VTGAGRALVAAGWLAACGPVSGPARPGSGLAIVYLDSNVRDAQVFVDGRFVAPLDALRAGLAVEPGVHRIELRRDDYFSGYRELSVGRAERTRVAIELAAVLP
jgi:hypothetical protein